MVARIVEDQDASEGDEDLALVVGVAHDDFTVILFVVHEVVVLCDLHIHAGIQASLDNGSDQLLVVDEGFVIVGNHV